MTVQTFIERAIEGGWLPFYHLHSVEPGGNAILIFNDSAEGAHEYKKFSVMSWNPEKILLDPLAWQAVGKVEGWKEDRNLDNWIGGWKGRMHFMIDALAEGKTIEQYLETL